MRLFRFLLANTSVSQLVTLYVACFVQLALITNEDPMVMESYGPCRYFEARTCFHVYQVAQTTALIPPISILVMFYFKYLSVSTLVIPMHRLVRCFILFHIPVIIFMISQFWTPQSVYRHPRDDNFYKVLNQDVTVSSIVAYLPLNSTLVIFTLSVVNVVAFVPVPFSWYLRKRILKEMHLRMDKMSPASQVQQKTFVMGLFIQVLIPTVFYPISSIVYYIFAIFEIELPMHKFSAFLVGALPSIVDPFISLYFVTPYRRRIKSWVKASEVRTLPVTRFSV